ncbi:type II toxin-antitoxin system RelE/ParE family toxin [Pedobacter aquatilis]|uniref:type II toxin-antitoxin system RelE/ParE family toxin n=1 Tax=Pedobacter aquatilis TaxID=351343 RepID=UPI0025B606D3|nr:type II toxin-antitoxin system RelE/ParE family toxin [Pedobacter aquatilis]MDN3586569.1 type II toxin-antitoxin system RelE/ParE family toxin [Pedobacter aquatilis]
MSLPVFWSDEAKETFDSIFWFIFNKFGEKAARKFLKQSNKVISIIRVQPEIFEAISSERFRKGRITNQTSIFYEIQNSKIHLLFFWDNRQEPLVSK